MDLLTIDESKCVKCGLCVAECPACLLSMGEHGPKCDFDRGCMACGHCVAVCPRGALDNKYTPRDEMLPLPTELPDSKQVYDMLRARRSVRQFRKEIPTQEDILRLLEVCRYAPTAGNSQGVYYTVISGYEKVQQVARVVAEWMQDEVDRGTPNKRYFQATLRSWDRGIDIIARNAPVLVFASVRRLCLTGPSNAEESFAYAELYAPAVGLGTTIAGFIGTCGIAGHQPLRELIGIPPKQNIAGCMMVGYPKVRYRLLPERQHLKIEFK